MNKTLTIMFRMGPEHDLHSSMQMLKLLWTWLIHDNREYLYSTSFITIDLIQADIEILFTFIRFMIY